MKIFMNVLTLLKVIKKVGISNKPKTPANVLEQYIDKIDLILIMTVEPGFGGQKFMSDQIEKIKQIKKIVGKKI